MIKGAAVTLREVETDARTRSELHDAIVAASEEIESVTFEPARHDQVEAELDATPRLPGRAGDPPA